jgi:hypothetical protein
MRIRDVHLLAEENPQLPITAALAKHIVIKSLGQLVLTVYRQTTIQDNYIQIF